MKIARRSPRWECRLACRIQRGELSATGVTANVSDTGLSIRLDRPQQEPFMRGEQLRFELTLPDAGEVEGEAEVVWATTSEQDGGRLATHGVAVRILSLTAKARSRFEAFIGAMKHVVLVTDDDPEYEPAYLSLADQYKVVRCASAAETLAQLEQGPVSAIVVSDRMSDGSCLGLLEQIARRLPFLKAARIVASESTIAGQLSTFINLGRVSGFLRKPFSDTELRDQLRQAIDGYTLAVRHEHLAGELERANDLLREENRYLRQRSVGVRGFEAIIGNSAELRTMLNSLERIRRSDATVHIHGETGTGKELVARALHEGGPRSGGPFVAQNCAGISEQLLQSTLFGHRRGAFTGADRDQDGVFQLASGGSLFLDEVAELSPSVQASLLRALQSGEVTPLGSDAPVSVNVRVISATHKDLRQEVREKHFREDLFYRLVVIPVSLPPLRERRGDIPLLAMHFLDRNCERHRRNVRGFAPALMRVFERYAWPGNVRELDNEIERLVLLVEEGAKIPLDLASPRILGTEGTSPGVTSSTPATPASTELRVPLLSTFDETISALQRVLIERALDVSGGNVSRAAQALKMERSRLSKLRTQLGLADADTGQG